MTADFFDDPANVEAYVEMAAGYDGRELIETLKRHLPEGAAVLELGMGPGVDLDILADTYAVTGSDTSQVFLDRYRAAHPDAELLRLDAVGMELPDARRFDAVYSNKVLHHLSREELAASLTAQRDRLRPGGYLLHSFWRGEGEEHIQGMRFTYWTRAALRELLDGVEGLAWVEDEVYEEMGPEDSIALLLQAPAAEG